MINEANAAMSHRDMQILLARILRRRGHLVATEHLLPNNKRADVLAAQDHNALHIYEIKTADRPYLLTAAYTKYAHYTNYLWLVVPTQAIHPRASQQAVPTWSEPRDWIGLLAIDWSGTRIIRDAARLPRPPLNLQLTLDRLSAAHRAPAEPRYPITPTEAG